MHNVSAFVLFFSTYHLEVSSVEISILSGFRGIDYSFVKSNKWHWVVAARNNQFCDFLKLNAELRTISFFYTVFKEFVST